jgi:uncharacterized membrane protein YdjX (TVP38/TMEM64 family)
MFNPAKNDRPSQPQAVTIILLSLLLVVVAAVYLTKDYNQIKTFISDSGPWGILISVILYGVLGLTIIPSEPLTVLIGAMFGPWVALLVAGTGNTLAAVVEYFLGHGLGKATNFIEKKEKLPLGLGKLPINSPVFLIGARMIPGYGPKIVSVLSGAYRVQMFLYVWTSAVPSFLGAAIFAFGGFGLKQLF